MATIFSKIMAREIPGNIIAENDHFCAFLDIMPLVAGHVLVVPKKETDYIFDMEDQALTEMMVFAKKIAIAMKAAIPCRRVGIAVIGLEVAHAHIHLVPLQTVNDINFTQPKLRPTAADLEATAAAIQSKILL